MLTALLLTGCAQKEEAMPHVAAYENANALLAEGKYADAAVIFESLNGYEESALLCMYARAKDKLSKGEYAQAFRGFTALGDFRDSALSAVYADACLMALDSDTWTVMKGAETLDRTALYMDSAERAANVLKSVYDEAQRLLSEGWPWKEARPFENGRGIVKAETQNGDKYGIVDANGKYVSNPNWDEIHSATDGIFLVKKKQ